MLLDAIAAGRFVRVVMHSRKSIRIPARHVNSERKYGVSTFADKEAPIERFDLCVRFYLQGRDEQPFEPLASTDLTVIHDGLANLEQNVSTSIFTVGMNSVLIRLVVCLYYCIEHCPCYI